MKPIIFTILVGFCFGLILGEWQNFLNYVLYIFLIIFCGLGVSYFFDQTIRTYFFYTTIVFLCASIFGLLRAQYAYETLPHPLLDQRIGQISVLTAEIISTIDLREDSIRFIAQPIFEDESINKNKRIPNIQITTDRFSNVSYGDIVKVEGGIKSVVSNDETFSRVGNMLIRKGVLYEMRYPDISIVSHTGGSWFKYYSIIIHDWIESTVARYIGEPSAGFINGILIGEKHGLTQEWYDLFTGIGLTHVIVLSGYNLAVLFAWIRSILRRTSFLTQNILGACGVITLVIVSGADAPAVRAGILVLIIAFSSIFFRQKDTAYFLTVTVLLMLIWNPFYLLYDVSFQLSVAATYGLVYIAPIIDGALNHFPKALSELIRDTTSAQLAVLPLQLFYFGSVSAISLFANLIILPFIPLLMGLGTMLLVVSWIPGLGILVGSGIAILADFVLFLVKKINLIALPIHFSLSIIGVIILYIFLILWIQRYKKI